MSTGEKLCFASDYMEGAHPAILQRLMETNAEQTPGYGTDAYSESARNKIRAACGAAEADVFFLTGGTQTNATVIGAMLKPYQGVIAAETGHISTHEAGAIEHGGHKVLTLPHREGKITAAAVVEYLRFFQADENRDHMVMPGMVYISQPTEYGTLYTRGELAELAGVCRQHGVLLYMDGARLAYALAADTNDATLSDIASACDAFYIGGTKCGAFFGEAVVIPEKNRIPHFFTIIKQQGALMAKGRIAGIQFDTLFSGDLYLAIGRHATDAAARIVRALKESGYRLASDSPTNQIFVRFSKAQVERITAQAALSFWENTADGEVVMRIATSWATTDEDVDALIRILKETAADD